MRHPSIHARKTPDKPAYIMAGSGETVTYRQLDERSNQGAHLFRSAGLKSGDTIAFLLENNPRYHELLWSAQRSGLLFTPISSKLTASEAGYIVKDCGAKVLVTSKSLADLANQLAPLIDDVKLYMVDGTEPAFEAFEPARDAQSVIAIADESAGSIMLYSSGTTGRPKGIKRIEAEAGPQPIDGPSQITLISRLGEELYGWSADSIYLSPAPLYHAAPLGWTMAVQALGGTVIVMEKFDAETALSLIEKHRVTTAQWVPTHFIRMLKLAPEVRRRYDLSSLTAVFHGAAPCPVPVKQQMIEWWGPIIGEYYSGTEGSGFCAINSEEWMAHKGSVGRCMTAQIHICNDEGEPLPPRAEGLVYFSGGSQFEYHGDARKTAENYNQHGWSTMGDVGWLDEEGYLYLTDRKSFMIISGGVNIYPQEIENLLIGHPKVADVAVIGAPHDDMGEQVVAVIQPTDWASAGPDLAEELAAWTRARLSHVKAPRRYDFMQELPRQATGKLFKRLIRDRYWAESETTVTQT